MPISSLTTAVAIVATACLGLASLPAAEVHGRAVQTSKHGSSAHHASTSDRVSKSSKPRSSTSSRSRAHSGQRAAKSNTKSRDRSRTAIHRNTEENVIPPDANVQVVLPTDDENGTEQDGDHSATLLGGGVQSDGMTAQEPVPPDNIDN